MTSESFAEQVLAGVRKAETLYHRLVIVASDGPGRTPALREVAARTGARVLNLNLEISRRMLDLTVRRRALQLPGVLEEIARNEGPLVLLDHFEILFDPALEQDPLRLLQGVSRDRTVVAAWPGTMETGCLSYAAPDHPEHRRYPSGDLPIVGLAGAAGRPHAARVGGRLRGAGRGDAAPGRAPRERR